MADCFINGQGGSGNSDYEFTFSTDGKFQYPSKLIVPNTVTSLQSNSLQGFYQHNEIEEIEFEDGCQITNLSGTYFHSCSGLKKITLPSKINTIAGNTFYNCTNLDTVVFDTDGVDVITFGAGVFSYCNKLNNIMFSQETTKIKISSSAQQIFDNCKELSDETFEQIMNRLTDDTCYVGTYMFRNCTGLFNVKSKIVGAYLFMGCTSLETAEIVPRQSTVNAYSSIFSGCTNLKSAIIKDIGIGTNFFGGCTQLNNVSLSNVARIDSNAFQNCSSLTELFLPSTITSFGGNTVFTGCTNLTNLSVGTDWNCVADFSVLDLTVESIEGIFNNLKDLTSETAKTLTLGTNNLLKTTAEQRTIATDKNWTLA